MAEEGPQGSEDIIAIPGVDRTKPSIARTYDYLLGGKDNFAVDRALADRFIKDLPGSRAIAFDNRGALTRAIREIAINTPVRQFIDLGSGLPTADNVHQVAQRHAPESKVVYVDNDPVVLAHGRALLAENKYTTVFQADLRDPRSIYESPDTRALIDFDQPVAIILSAVLHHVNDDEDPAALVRFWYDRIPSGSYVFISHFRSEEDPRSAQLQKILQTSLGRGRWGTNDEILALFGNGLTVLPRASSPQPNGARPSRPTNSPSGNASSRPPSPSSPEPARSGAAVRPRHPHPSGVAVRRPVRRRSAAWSS